MLSLRDLTRMSHKGVTLPVYFSFIASKGRDARAATPAIRFVLRSVGKEKLRNDPRFCKQVNEMFSRPAVAVAGGGA